MGVTDITLPLLRKSMRACVLFVCVCVCVCTVMLHAEYYCSVPEYRFAGIGKVLLFTIQQFLITALIISSLRIMTDKRSSNRSPTI